MTTAIESRFRVFGCAGAQRCRIRDRDGYTLINHESATRFDGVVVDPPAWVEWLPTEHRWEDGSHAMSDGQTIMDRRCVECGVRVNLPNFDAAVADMGTPPWPNTPTFTHGGFVPEPVRSAPAPAAPAPVPV